MALFFTNYFGPSRHVTDGSVHPLLTASGQADMFLMALSILYLLLWAKLTCYQWLCASITYCFGPSGNVTDRSVHPLLTALGHANMLLMALSILYLLLQFKLACY